MKPFAQHTGIVATLNRSNVDTDQIIPKQFLKSIKRTGYGPNAFFDWRYNADGTPNPEFELNDSRFDGRSILVARNNFGCGSSREHAVWALVQDGYAVIIAPWKPAGGTRLPAYADIFSSNAIKNGLLPIELAEEEVDYIFALVERYPGIEATVDLPEQQIIFLAPEPVAYDFDIEASAKEQLINGQDDIDLTLQFESEIDRFEQQHDPYFSAPE